MGSNLQNNPLVQKLTGLNESTWIHLGSLAEMMNEPEKAMKSYESALRHNPYSFTALFQIAALHRAREQYAKATEYFQRALNIENSNGEVWGALGHCYLMMDDLQKAYSAYQQALYHGTSQRDPKLWYGIGILYDRYGSLEHAEEAFSAVMRMEPKFEKGSEIYFRLGIIYKQQHKYELSLQCFRYILSSPPRPLTDVDIWFQIGHVYEQQKDFNLAKEAYERVLSENPSHAKVLQQLGWLYHQSAAPFEDQDKAIVYLNKSIEADPNDPQTFYLLGRCFMAQSKYGRAYEAYQQAVYRDGKNAAFWCSIGVLYYQINQFRDALDAYSRAIRINPHISEVWYDLGTLYESCNNQIEDARDAYSRALDLDPNNQLIRQRLNLLNSNQSERVAPVPQDINPNHFQNSYANGNGHIARFNQGPIGPGPGVQSYPPPPRQEPPSLMPPPIPNGDRSNHSHQDQLAPLMRMNNTNSPNPRGGHHLPNILREEHTRPVDPGHTPRHPYANEHSQYSQSLLQHPDALRAPNTQPGFHRQPIKRTEPSNVPIPVDNRKMSLPSPAGISNRPHNGSSVQHRPPESNYYHHQESVNHHNERREQEDIYRQQRPPPYSRPEHSYMNERHMPHHESPYHHDAVRRSHQVSTRPSPMVGHGISRTPREEEKSPFQNIDNHNRIEEKPRPPIPSHLSRPSEPMASPKFNESRKSRHVDEDYDGAADTLVSMSQSYSYKSHRPPTPPKPQNNESNNESNNINNNLNSYHPSQLGSPRQSPKNQTNGSHPDERNGTSSRRSTSQA